MIIHLWKNCHLNESDTTSIDKVYFVMNAQENGSIEELKGIYDYIQPSNKLDHIPNATFFIKGCTQAFKNRHLDFRRILLTSMITEVKETHSRPVAMFDKIDFDIS